MSNHHSFAHADATRRNRTPLNDDTHSIPMRDETMERLAAWFLGEIALKRSEAHRLLEIAVDSGQILQHHAEFVSAIKALAVGPKNWIEMGYRLLPDD